MAFERVVIEQRLGITARRVAISDASAARRSTIKRLAARIASLLTSVLGIAVGLYLLFGETGTRCSVTSSGQVGTTTALSRCESTRMVDVQPVWPMPLLALAVWSLAPLLAVAGTWAAPVRTRLVIVALAIEATSVISFGAGPYYIPFVLTPLVVTWVLARRAERLS